MITDEDLAKAIDRIARSADGELLYLFFQRVIMELPSGPDPSDSALRAHAGRRSLAGEIIGRMSKGIAESGGRTDQPTGERRERPIVFAPREPVAGARRESPREFIRRTELGPDAA